MKLFDQGWWSCFNSYTNELINIGGYSANSDIGTRVLHAAGITPKECDEAIRKELVYGKTIDVINEYLER